MTDLRNEISTHNRWMRGTLLFGVVIGFILIKDRLEENRMKNKPNKNHQPSLYLKDYK